MTPVHAIYDESDSCNRLQEGENKQQFQTHLPFPRPKSQAFTSADVSNVPFGKEKTCLIRSFWSVIEIELFKTNSDHIYSASPRATRFIELS
mmetsp:Transcript_19434/g.77590  ORF Transcript_19434/g.77590 Transcript_19434/m.77590 type:complete len:92 (-) Transcript_19434:19-294(-)